MAVTRGSVVRHIFVDSNRESWQEIALDTNWRREEDDRPLNAKVAGAGPQAPRNHLCRRHAIRLAPQNIILGV